MVRQLLDCGDESDDSPLSDGTGNPRARALAPAPQKSGDSVRLRHAQSKTLRGIRSVGVVNGGEEEAQNGRRTKGSGDLKSGKRKAGGFLYRPVVV